MEDALKELYVHYKIKLDKHNDETFTVSSSSTPSEDDCSMKIDLDDGFSKRDNSFDVLGWWNQNMKKFPILSQVAKHVLAMPISTVASESAFNTGGRVIDKYRSSLTPNTAEALICAQDWLWSTLADLQDMPINGLPLEEMVENLVKLELEALICAQDWLRSTPADLQDMPINGLPLEKMVENLEKLELDMFSNGKNNAMPLLNIKISHKGTTYKAVVQPDLTNLPEKSRKYLAFLIERLVGNQMNQSINIAISPVYASSESSGGREYVDARADAQLFVGTGTSDDGIDHAGSGVAGLSSSRGFHQSCRKFTLGIWAFLMSSSSDDCACALGAISSSICRSARVNEINGLSLIALGLTFLVGGWRWRRWWRHYEDPESPGDPEAPDGPAGGGGGGG
nr:zinc finger BED domain-containing protein RICESLEEPER 2-like [Tanacetum cinerariifolium]